MSAAENYVHFFGLKILRKLISKWSNLLTEHVFPKCLKNNDFHNDSSSLQNKYCAKPPCYDISTSYRDFKFPDMIYSSFILNNLRKLQRFTQLNFKVESFNLKPTRTTKRQRKHSTKYLTAKDKVFGRSGKNYFNLIQFTKQYLLDLTLRLTSVVDFSLLELTKLIYSNHPTKM